MHNSGKGRDGEDLAAAFLEEKGLRVIARNIRSPRGEIDIAALEGETLVFAEVKTWSALGIEELEHSLTAEKQRRIIETAKYFLLSHREYKSMAVRFDVLFIRRPPPGIRGDEIPPSRKPAVTHLVSAFTECV
jgi:putative endonuclease